MSVAIVTGSGGLIGAEAVRYFADKGFDVVGIDNDMRRYFFGDEASTSWSVSRLSKTIPTYRHYDLDIREEDGIKDLFEKYDSAS